MAPIATCIFSMLDFSSDQAGSTSGLSPKGACESCCGAGIASAQKNRERIVDCRRILILPPHCLGFAFSKMAPPEMRLASRDAAHIVTWRQPGIASPIGQSIDASSSIQLVCGGGKRDQFTLKT